MFPRLRDICKLMRDLDPEHEPFINLFPSYAEPERLGSPDFRSHVREFIETVRPGLLSYDYYALRESGMMAGFPTWRSFAMRPGKPASPSGSSSRARA